MNKILDENDIKKKIKRLYGDEYSLVSKYLGTSKPITLKHNPCGTIYTTSKANRFLNEGKSLCPNCRKPVSHSTKRKTEEDIRTEIDKVEGYKYIEGFVRTNSKVKIYHKDCDSYFYMTPHMFLGSYQRRCPICANKRRGPNAPETYLKDLLQDKEYGDDYEWLDDYHGNNKEKLRIKHKECGTIYTVRPNDFQQGYKCPTCSAKASDEEQSLCDYISSVYKDEIIQHYKAKPRKIELDIYLPEKKIGFEYNGWYWHSDKFRDKNYHLNKYNFFKERGISVVFIDSQDWKDHRDIMEDKISAILGVLPYKIPARKTLIDLASSDEQKAFFTENHIQGYAPAKFAFGLYMNNEPVAMMSFASARANVNQRDSSTLELLRFAVKKQTSVIGGFSKILQNTLGYIKENYPEIKQIKSFADMSLSLNGNVYTKNGFVLDHISKPSYYYVYKWKKVNRYQFRKDRLKVLFPEIYSEDKTEFEITDQVKNLYRVWNLGNYVFMYYIK